MNKDTLILGALIFGSSGLGAVEKKPVTFTEHIAPIIFNNCTTCHRKGEGGPFAFTTYAEVAKRARLIARVTESRYMPPWHAHSADYKFKDERRLTEKQIDLIAQWVETGASEGDPKKLPAMPKFTLGWQLGKPDLVVKMAEAYTVPAEGRDIYRSFVIPLNLPENKWLKAMEFRPGAPSVVHHSLFRYDTTGRARRLDERSETPGFTGMGRQDGRGATSLGGWAVGGTARFLPEGLAYRLPKDSDLVMDMHFHLSGKAEKEVSTVGLYFTDKAPENTFTDIQMPPSFGALSRVDIPAGKKDYTVNDTFTLPIDVEAFGVSAHAHYLGKELKMTANLPDGKTRELIWIKDWDFSWQEQYHYEDFVSLPKGTRIDTKVVWDNSAENPNNPSNPPKRVRWGLQSTDEMGSLSLMVKPKRAQEIGSLNTAMRQHARDHSVARALQREGGLGARILDAAMRSDRNGDGKVSRAEVPRWLSNRFERIDSNADGQLSREELQKALSRLGN